MRLMMTVMGVLLTLSAVAEGMKHHQMPAVTHDGRQGARQGEADNRVPVSFPGDVYDATLASMREHLRAIDLVIASIAAGDYDRAALAAEQGLGTVISMGLMVFSLVMRSCQRECGGWVIRCI